MIKLRITKPITDQELIIPVDLTFTETGHDMIYQEYDNQTMEENTNPIVDYELTRYSYKPPPSFVKSRIYYEFNFFSGTTYDLTYNNDGFTNEEIYYVNNDFEKSFFKLDFYDKVDRGTQKLYLTIILSTVEGTKSNQLVNLYGYTTPQFKPVFRPYYLIRPDTPNYYIYWKKDPGNLTTFYMSCKFFNAKNGKISKFINTDQTLLTSPNQFNSEDYFYYKVDLDASNYSYNVTDMNTGLYVGNNIFNRIKFYQYINP